MCYVVMWYPPTSTIVILAALHMGWLKFRAVFLIKSTWSTLKSVKLTLDLQSWGEMLYMKDWNVFSSVYEALMMKSSEISQNNKL